MVIFIISEAPLFSGPSGHNCVTSQYGEQINSGIREIWTKLCVICRNILLYKLTVELFPAVSSCRISTSSISLSFACTCLQFRSKTSLALGNERGLEPVTTLETRVRSSYVFNQSVVCFLPKNKIVRKTFHNMNIYCRNYSGNKAKPFKHSWILLTQTFVCAIDSSKIIVNALNSYLFHRSLRYKSPAKVFSYVGVIASVPLHTHCL